MNNPPSKHHTVTAAYIKRFSNGKKVLRHIEGQKPKLRSPRGVGYQRDFWGSPELAQEMEDAFNRCENSAMELLKELDAELNVAALSSDQRGLLAEFMGIHIVRLPAFGRMARRVARESALEALVKHGAYSEENLQRAVDALQEPRQHNTTLIGRISAITGTLASMHWSIVTFDQDLLITGDQPVALMPMQSATINSGSAVPPGGMMNILEGRFTLDPRKLLLMTWQDDNDVATPIAGTFAQACSVNTGVRALAEREWLSRPDSAVPFVMPPFRHPNLYAISTELLHGYTVAAAMASTRRSRTDSLMRERWASEAPPELVRFVGAGGRPRPLKSNRLVSGTGRRGSWTLHPDRNRRTRPCHRHHSNRRLPSSFRLAARSWPSISPAMFAVVPPATR
jgi:hypothetical protein